MKFLKPLTGIVVFAASTVFTSPVEGIEKRTPGGVYICTDINWGGTCGYAVQPLDECIRLGPDWDGKISSFGPDPCTACVGYAQNDCDEGDWLFTYPGDATGGLATDNPWNDQLGAFECSQTC